MNLILDVMFLYSDFVHYFVFVHSSLFVSVIVEVVVMCLLGYRSWVVVALFVVFFVGCEVVVGPICIGYYMMLSMLVMNY